MSKTPPMSLRLPPDLRPVVASYAKDLGLKPHAAVVQLVKLGLERVTLPVTTPSPKAVLARAEAQAAHLAAPKPVRRKRVWSLKGVQLGPTDPPMGSRLKGAKK